MFKRLRFRIDWTRTRACCTPSCRYTRCRRCSCWSGPCELCKLFNFNHVAEVEAASTWRHMLSWSYHLSNQFKTGVRMRLTSQIKKLEQIYKNWLNLNKFWSKNETNDDVLALLAMRINFLTKSWARCNNGNDLETKCSHKNWKWEKKESRLNSVWLVNKKDTN